MSLVFGCRINSPLVPSIPVAISSSSPPCPNLDQRNISSASASFRSPESEIGAGDGSRSVNVDVFDIREFQFSQEKKPPPLPLPPPPPPRPLVSVSGSSTDSDDEQLLCGEEDEEHEGKGEFTEERWPCLTSIEESLPIKRGLSNHFSGRSKSFADLTEPKTVNDLVKPENPLNKKRRTLLAWKWRRSFSSYGLSHHGGATAATSMNEQVTKTPCFILQPMKNR